MWRRIISAKFDIDDWGCFTRESSRPYGRSLWKKLIQRKVNFLECTKWKVGRGNRVRSWEDKWMEEDTLMAHFPHNYTIVQQKNIKICDSLAVNSSRGKEWQVLVSRLLND